MLLWLLGTGLGGAADGQPELGLNQPLQVTAETDSVGHIAVSADGRWLVYTQKGPIESKLWLRSADPAVIVLPRALGGDGQQASSPALAPDGRTLAFVGSARDVKGDIYLLDMESTTADPLRLTGSTTEDGGPCFSPDGRRIYFHQAEAGGPHRIVSVALEDLDDRRQGPLPEPLSTDVAGTFPSISPDGRQMAFVSYTDAATAAIGLHDLSSGETRLITSGTHLDASPAWSGDGARVIFSRVKRYNDAVKDEAGALGAVLFEKQTADNGRAAFPLTAEQDSARQPKVGGGRLFFLSSRGGTSNCWSLPETGTIPTASNVENQMRLAHDIASRVPRNVYLSVLAYARVMARFPEARAYAAAACYHMARLYQQIGYLRAARSSFQKVVSAFADQARPAALAAIQLATIGVRLQQQRAPTDRQGPQVLTEAIETIRRIAQRDDPVVRARADIEGARLLFENDSGAASLSTAIDWLEGVAEEVPDHPNLAAEALLLKADIFSRIAPAEAVYPLYLAVLTNTPGADAWIDSAVSRLLDLDLADIGPQGLEDQVRRLREIAFQNQKDHPQLCIGALNRLGDLYYAADEWHLAKQVYREVLDRFGGSTRQTAAARLALAEILYKEERFRAALDLYETEIDVRDRSDRIYRLARIGYVRKSIAAGEYLYTIGEVLSARATFGELIQYDPSIVEAHRGYIKCAVALDQLATVAADYRKRLDDRGDDPLAMYTVALCLSYRNRKVDLLDAKDLLIKAIRLDGRSEYFHQTLGYVLEVLETVYGEQGLLELALDAYRKAYFLNDHQNNPTNAANLNLNLGNAYFTLGQFQKAFEHYRRRLEYPLAFNQPDTEILFYRRLGASGFQIRAPQQTIDAFEKALELIQAHTDPYRPSMIFDRIHRYLMDRILSPAIRQPAWSDRAGSAAEKQSALYRRLSEISRQVYPPPATEWGVYRDALLSLLDRQQALVQNAVALLRDGAESDVAPDEAQQTIAALSARVRQALASPERLLALKAEVLDRLGLAYQEAEQWRAAIETFQQVLALNRQRGAMDNLSRNMRAVAYNTYRLAGERSGTARQALLEDAAQGFARVIELVERYGVPERKAANTAKDAMLNLAFQVSLNRDDATGALYGFTADQEKRLAEAFRFRIHIEQGDYAGAQAALNEQLKAYGPGVAVAEKDRFGVALLYHQAGLLTVARQQWPAAFDHFERSAKMTLELEHAFSTAINIRNLVHVFQHMQLPHEEMTVSLRKLGALDRQASRLLNTVPPPDDGFTAAAFHNVMGTFFYELSREMTADPAGAVQGIGHVTTAGMHFSRGIRLLSSLEAGAARRRRHLAAVLRLNMAATAQACGDIAAVGEHLESALDIARQALLPDVQWRALAGLGRLQEALAVLERVTIQRAGCRPFEIMGTFGGMVEALATEGNYEAAFNAAERLAELERMHRMAFLLNQIPDSEKRMYREVYPRLIRIQTLHERLAKEAGENSTFLKDNLERERKLLRSKLGPDEDNVSALIRGIRENTVRRQIMILLGLARHAEEAAEQNDPDTYDACIEQYVQRRSRLKMGALDKDTGLLPSCFTAAPVEAFDVAEHLPEQGVLWRLFPLSTEQKTFLLFALSADEIQASRFESLDALRAYLAAQPIEDGYVAGEDPFWISSHPDVPRVLNGTHLVRSVVNRKPFKRELMTIPAVEWRIADFNQRRPDNGDDENPSKAVQRRRIHTLLLSDPIGLTLTAPTRGGESAFKAIGVMSATRPRVHLTTVLADLQHLSLAVLPRASHDSVYFIAQLFALYGCPTVLFPAEPGEHEAFVTSFLSHYARMSARAALQQSLSVKPEDKRWVLLGYQGMSPEAAADLARTRFVHYVKTGRGLMADNAPTSALPYFENALKIALETPALQKYLSGLYRFARESAYRSGDIDAARQYAARLLKIMQHEKPDSGDHAEALSGLGLIHARQERFAEAIPLLEAAVDILAFQQAGNAQISALANLGIVLENATDYDRALAVFKDAAALSQSLDQGRALADQYVNIARIHDLRLSRYLAAIDYFKKALELYRQMDATPKIAQTRLDIGRCRRLLGDFPTAAAHYEQALVLAQRARMPVLETKIRLEQANNAWFRADYQQAFEQQRRALRMAQTHDLPLLQVMARNTEGLFWWTLGNNEKALQTLESTLANARKLGIRKDEVASTLNNLGIVYRELERYPAALAVFDEALTIDRRLKSRWAVAYDLRNKAQTFLKMGRPDAAVALFRESAQIARAIGNRINEAKALLGLGTSLAESGREGEARAAFQSAQTLAETMRLKETLWRSIYGLARLELDNRPPVAEALLFEAVEIIEGMRADIKIEQLKNSFVDNKLSVYEDLVKLLADQGKIAAAFELAERSRARNFIDLLGNQRMSLSRSIDQALYDRMRDLRQQIDEQSALLARSSQPAERAAYQEALNTLNNELENVMLDIQAANPQLSSLVTVMPTQVEALQEKIEPTVALVSYYLLPSEVLCWVVRQDGIRLQRTSLDRKRLGQAILEYRRSLQNLEPSESRSQALFDWLIAPVFEHLNGIETLGVVPHAALHYLSFATLMDDNAYLIDRFALFYLPSASILDYTLGRRSPKSGDMRVLAVGNPSLGDPLFDLPFAEHEVNAIKWRFPKIEILTRSKATEDWIVDNIDRFEIIHLASHGEFDPVNPLFSAIKLAKGPRRDGDLDAADIFGLQINADMVFLSACQTGLGRVTRGDDVIGLNRAFLYAGTHTIISSLWRVSDISTAIMIKHFYRRYVTTNKANSLRQAMLHVKTVYPHAGYWGAFTLVGDYE